MSNGLIDWAVIGGSGLLALQDFKLECRHNVETPFGDPSAEIMIGTLSDKIIAFLPRHGKQHTIAPHQVNYRANLWALKDVGVEKIIAVAAVGGIHPDVGPGAIVIPDQLIDYTYGREHTFYATELSHVTHIDFTFPYTQALRAQLLDAGRQAHIEMVARGCYGATQGPRLETAQEINRLDQDGCSIVGMTGMPEAALARELDLAYANLSVVVNPAAGRGEGVISMAQIEHNLALGMDKAHAILRQFFLQLT